MAAVNEVIKTVGATGRDHSTIVAWEADTDEDCTAGWGAGDYSSPCSPVGSCYDDADFTDAVTIAGATTDSTHYRRLTAAVGERHAGKDGAGVKSTAQIILGNYDDYGIVEYLIIDTSTTEQFKFYYSHNGTSLTLRKCVVCGSGEIGIGSNDGGISRTLYVQNCIVHGLGGSYPRPIKLDSSENAPNVQNCSVTCGTYRGVVNAACTNVISSSASGTAFVNCTGDYNISSDATAPGANSIDNVAPADIYLVVTGGSEDLHLKDGATAADNAASDLSGTFTDDIDSETRADWDIGADEIVSAAGYVPYPYPLHELTGGVKE